MTKGRERNEKKKDKKNKTIRAKLMLFMDIVDDDQLYPAICSILPVQYSRRQLYYCNKN